MTARARPARPFSPLVTVVPVLAIWWFVAHDSGAGWMQIVGEVAFGAICVGLVGPAVVLSRAHVVLLSAPGDGTAGAPIAVTVRASTRLRIRPLSPPGGEAFVGPRSRHRPPDETVTLVPALRGLHTTLTLDVATAAPFGMQWWRRRVVLALPSALHVAPRAGHPAAFPQRPQKHRGEQSEHRTADEGQPKGARPYASGDDRRHIHWSATAHSGELMVRELEGPSSEPVTVVVRLPSDENEAELLAGRALATVVRLLDRGDPVLLDTTEDSGRVTALVVDQRSAGRRLARAVAAPAGGPPGVSVSP